MKLKNPQTLFGHLSPLETVTEQTHYSENWPLKGKYQALCSDFPIYTLLQSHQLVDKEKLFRRF